MGKWVVGTNFVCDSFFYDSTALKRHLLIHAEEREEYPCTYQGCDVVCVTEKNLNIHLRVHAEVRETFPCTFDGCQTVCSRKADLENHIKIHTGVKEHVCEHCGGTFHLKGYLQYHLEKHAELLQCDLCGFCTAHYRSMKLHMEGHLKKYQCLYCGSNCGNRTTNKNHYLRFHQMMLRSNTLCTVCKKPSLHTHNDPVDARSCFFCEAAMPNLACLIEHSCEGKTKARVSKNAAKLWILTTYQNLFKEKPQLSFTAGAKKIPMLKLWICQEKMVLLYSDELPVDQRKFMQLLR